MGYHGGTARSCSSFADPTPKKKASDLKLILLAIFLGRIVKTIAATGHAAMIQVAYIYFKIVI
jgi:hypothetical protein